MERPRTSPPSPGLRKAWAECDAARVECVKRWKVEFREHIAAGLPRDEACELATREQLRRMEPYYKATRDAFVQDVERGR